MARTEKRWKDGKFRSGVFTPDTTELVLDFGPELAPDRLIVSADYIISAEHAFWWKGTNDPSDTSLVVPSPEMETLHPGLGLRSLVGGGELVLEVSEGYRYWTLLFVTDPSANGSVLIEGGQAAAPNQ